MDGLGEFIFMTAAMEPDEDPLEELACEAEDEADDDIWCFGDEDEEDDL